MQKSPETVCYEIFREILRAAREFDASQYLVVASQLVIDMLLEEESTGLADLQDFIRRDIKLQVDIFDDPFRVGLPQDCCSRLQDDPPGLPRCRARFPET